MSTVYGYAVVRPEAACVVTYETPKPLTGWRLALGICAAVIGGIAIAAVAYFVGAALIDRMQPKDWGKLGGYFVLGFMLAMMSSRRRR